jgi:hypothetical protein
MRAALVLFVRFVTGMRICLNEREAHDRDIRSRQAQTPDDDTRIRENITAMRVLARDTTDDDLCRQSLFVSMQAMQIHGIGYSGTGPVRTLFHNVYAYFNYDGIDARAMLHSNITQCVEHIEQHEMPRMQRYINLYCDINPFSYLREIIDVYRQFKGSMGCILIRWDNIHRALRRNTIPLPNLVTTLEEILSEIRDTVQWFIDEIAFIDKSCVIFPYYGVDKLYSYKGFDASTPIEFFSEDRWERVYMRFRIQCVVDKVDLVLQQYWTAFLDIHGKKSNTFLEGMQKRRESSLSNLSDELCMFIIRKYERMLLVEVFTRVLESP